ncbi:hypothetical protein LTR53_007217 [Teratosphaeriaceae sp. CCFEE 6253]|nr:hypothetical protein LTR53_007217 [Teratosphaeriaceae sp. CCFEE 6253]
MQVHVLDRNISLDSTTASMASDDMDLDTAPADDGDDLDVDNSDFSIDGSDDVKIIDGRLALGGAILGSGSITRLPTVNEACSNVFTLPLRMAVNTSPSRSLARPTTLSNTACSEDTVHFQVPGVRSWCLRPPGGVIQAQPAGTNTLPVHLQQDAASVGRLRVKNRRKQLRKRERSLQPQEATSASAHQRLPDATADATAAVMTRSANALGQATQVAPEESRAPTLTAAAERAAWHQARNRIRVERKGRRQRAAKVQAVQEAEKARQSPQGIGMSTSETVPFEPRGCR